MLLVLSVCLLSLAPGMRSALVHPATPQLAVPVVVLRCGLRTQRAEPVVMKLKGRAGFERKRQMIKEESMMGSPRARTERAGGSKSMRIRLSAAVNGVGAAGDIVTVKPAYASYLVARGSATMLQPGLVQRSRKLLRLANETEEERAAREAKIKARLHEAEEEAVRWTAERLAVAAAADAAEVVAAAAAAEAAALEAAR